MHIITRTQNLPDGSKCPVWKLKRLGIPSASENGCIITPKRHDYSASRSGATPLGLHWRR
jgi:hypothetical protein